MSGVVMAIFFSGAVDCRSLFSVACFRSARSVLRIDTLVDVGRPSFLFIQRCHLRSLGISSQSKNPSRTVSYVVGWVWECLSSSVISAVYSGFAWILAMSMTVPLW